MSTITSTPTVIRSMPTTFDDAGDIPRASSGQPLSAGLSARVHGQGPVKNIQFDFENVRVAVTDTGGANGGRGTLELFRLPAGYVIYSGITTRFSMTRESTGIGATATVATAIGSAPETTDATLDSTQADILGSANSTLASGTALVTRVGPTSDVRQDGSALTPGASVWLNFGVPDASITASDALILSGRINMTIVYVGTTANV